MPETPFLESEKLHDTKLERLLKDRLIEQPIEVEYKDGLYYIGVWLKGNTSRTPPHKRTLRAADLEFLKGREEELHEAACGEEYWARVGEALECETKVLQQLDAKEKKCRKR